MNKKTIIVIIVVLGVLAILMSVRDTSPGVVIEPNDTSVLGPYVSLNYDDKDARDEALYKMELRSQIHSDPKELADFLFTHTQFNGGVVDSVKRAQIVGKVAMSFVDDKDVHKTALARADDILSQLHIDCDWKAIRELAPRSDDFESYEAYKQYWEQANDIPLLVCENGEPISSELNGEWEGPADK